MARSAAGGGIVRSRVTIYCELSIHPRSIRHERQFTHPPPAAEPTVPVRDIYTPSQAAPSGTSVLTFFEPVADTVVVGAPVFGPGVPAATTITGITAPNVIYLSAVLTETVPAETEFSFVG